MAVEHKDLYSAWEASYGDTIEGFRHDDEHEVPAYSQTYIEKLPNVLFFMIKRIAFDKEKNKYSKNNNVFEYDPVIFPDRFLYSNRERSEKLRDQANELREKSRKLQDYIGKFKNYNDKGSELGSVIHSCTTLLKSNIEGMQTDDQTEGITLFSPESICKLADPSSTDGKINDIVDYLNKLLDTTNGQVKNMEDQLADLQKQIEKLYEPMNTTPYYLSSIMVHEGDHQGGHYYTFIKDFARDIFRKYNDYIVTQEPNERVDELSKGGHGTANAYCLIYVNKQTYDRCCDVKLNTYKLQFRNEEPSDYYNSLVPSELAENVFKENDKLLQLIEDSESSDKAQKIMEMYDRRMKKIMDFKEENSSNKLIKHASPLIELLEKPQNQNKDFTNIGKWFLFNQCFVEVTGIDGGIQSIENDNVLLEKLRTSIKGTKHKNAPISVRITDAENTKLMEVLSVYPESIKDVIVSIPVLIAIVESNYLDALCYIAKRKEERQENFSKATFLRDSVRVLSLHSTSQINQSIIKGSGYEEAILPLLHNLVFIFKYIITNREDNHFKQVQINLKATYNLGNQKMEGYAQEFADWVKVFEEDTINEVELPGNFCPKYPEDVVGKFKEIDKIDYCSKWNDVYSQNNIIYPLYEMFIRK